MRFSKYDSPACRSCTQKPESEIHAAINPLDENNLIVAGNIIPRIQPEFSIDMNAWTEDSFLFKPINGGGDPVLAFDADQFGSCTA